MLVEWVMENEVKSSTSSGGGWFWRRRKSVGGVWWRRRRLIGLERVRPQFSLYTFYWDGIEEGTRREMEWCVLGWEEEEEGEVRGGKEVCREK